MILPRSVAGCLCLLAFLLAVPIASGVSWLTNRKEKSQVTDQSIAKDPKHDVAFLVFATGKYLDLLPTLVKSLDEFFCAPEKFNAFVKKHVVVFTDRDEE